MGHIENRVSRMEDKIEKLNHSEKVILTKLKNMENFGMPRKGLTSKCEHRRILL